MLNQNNEESGISGSLITNPITTCLVDFNIKHPCTEKKGSYSNIPTTDSLFLKASD